MQITATIVLYQNDREMLGKAIHSFLDTSLDVKLYLVDNSPLPELENIVSDPRVEYFYLNSNRGFGSGHNVIMRRPGMMGKYHLVLNPDIYFGKGTLESLFEYMESNPDVANVMPKVYYPSGKFQYLCRLLPTPRDWFLRMFCPIKAVKDKINYQYEMMFADYDKEMNVPFLSGCFMFFRTSAIQEIGVFDEHIFMYGEDTDLNRRLYRKYRTMYYPGTAIYHNHERGSHKNFRLAWVHVKAAIYYMNKWGWIFDAERRQINNMTIRQYSK